MPTTDKTISKLYDSTYRTVIRLEQALAEAVKLPTADHRAEARAVQRQLEEARETIGELCRQEPSSASLIRIRALTDGALGVARVVLDSLDERAAYRSRPSRHLTNSTAREG